MNQNSIKVLEFIKIREQLKGHAATSYGKDIISNLNPVSDLDYVKRSLSEVTAGKEILDEFGNPPFGGIRDLREILQKVSKGIVLSSKELMNVRTTLGGFNSLHSFFRKLESELDPRLVEKRLSVVTDRALELIPLPEIEKKLDRCLDEYGQIKDTASRKLANLRSEISRIENRIRDKMDSIIKGNKYKSMLQDALITKRGDRYVVPVKYEYRNAFGGIVHDQSASGLTLFMEPIAIVKMNNNLRELKREEENEIYRILQELTETVSINLEELKSNLKITSFLDVVFARAGYSQAIGGIAPDVNCDGVIKIKGGRHPLLKDEAVPIDVEVGENFSTLVITGPNTGGKTVALKTIGLFILMTEAGLHIPARRGTEISIFKQVFADIGDEQSIEQNLSTFSSHVNKIKRFLEKADSHSLVLLDELGAGTDPREGAALGIAILERFRSRKVVTVATTHYSQLKSYAYSQKGVENASVEFDLETLQPTYRLLMGIPGGSNAFAIALKLGIPEGIISEAKELLSGEEIEIEKIIVGLNKDRKRYQELKEHFLNKDREVKKLKEKYEKMLKELEEEKEEVIREANLEAENIINDARKETREILRNLKNVEFNSRPEIDRKANEINEKMKSIEKQFRYESDSQDVYQEKEITVGDLVRLKSVGQKGEVLSIDKDKNEATVQAGIITLTAGIDDLIKVELPDENKEELVNSYRVQKSKNVSPKLDLRGERYEVAQDRLDKYLDDVFLAGLKQVEIIHGKGTGALREAVQEVLEKNPHISSFRLGRQEEGGSGVTIATFKN